MGHAKSSGLKFVRRLTNAGKDPFDEVEWDSRSAIIVSEKGETIFKQENLEIPKPWSQVATNVVASKYFRGPDTEGIREHSVKQIIARVVQTLVEWGSKDGYFATERDAEVFDDELKSIILNQMATFNSPVWFNVGVSPDDKPQASACFINSIDDTMDSIMELATVEANLFKGGSGTGTNFSSLRSSKEALSGGGKASGPVSFMKGFDAFAGVIKSGGKTRRAAKMVILNADHPDIEEFIQSKMLEEKKAWALIEIGYDSSLNGEAYSSVFFQNSNNSVRVTDEFMEKVEGDGQWDLKSVLTGETVETVGARDIFNLVASVAHMCGDPGLQFDTTVNTWHTCKASGRINASNPCSEFMFIDDSSCNLASLNLMKFLKEDGTFDVDLMTHVVDIVITAQEIIVDNARYPTERIANNSSLFRPLGIGYANLGALLMAKGLPYDSEDGRVFAAAVTALLTGEAYAQSAKLATKMGPFDRYDENRDCMLDVMDMHMAALDELEEKKPPKEVITAARQAWAEAIEIGEKAGFRNAQVSVLAPTGTIGFMMDCDTMGIEPDIALIKYKNLVGGGTIRMVNKTVPLALQNLGYDQEEIKSILGHIDRKGTIEGTEMLKEEHLAVFDCALKPRGGNRVIAPEGHVQMMAAVQPFISGAISKTVNLSTDVTVEKIGEIYMDAWKRGLKALSIYRDDSKKTQPLATGSGKKAAAAVPQMKPFRRRMPDERHSITHKFNIAGHEGYLIIGMYEDGTPGEIFIKMAKEGSTISGLMDSFALAISMTFQYGVPLKVLVEKFTNTRFEPSGYTNNREVPHAKSIMDYIFSYLAVKFLPSDGKGGKKEEAAQHAGQPDTTADDNGQIDLFMMQSDAPLCPDCGFMMVRSGACYRCMNCGSSSGCS
ncbi:MAG: vitamin B12-dependent ribonucleotide reductase [Pseudomonadota bacterium]